ncbi:uncharacterized protein LOC126669741 [Mercurialis annua]|uniref:uncharacterized protein LOC126669741 n=1 Tax=Mercurialis annua TaxID=3986 RepID=UPI00215EF9B7|nr:uncharacterized protein LOC126669741 [Mercurialis annua]
MSSFKIGLSKQAIFAVTLLILLLSLLVCTSFAASGGRMGGSSFSKSRRSSSSSSRPSYSNYHHRHHYHHHTNTATGYSSSSNTSTWSPWWWEGLMIICILLVILIPMAYCIGISNGSSLIMIQVGLTGKANTLQKKLNEIAKTTDTSSSKGWNLILSETTSTLLQHQHYFISGYMTEKNHTDIETLEKNLKQLLNEERQKIDIESLVNVNNVRRQIRIIHKSRKSDKSYIVVTIFIAAKGCYKLSAIKSIDELKTALQSLKFSSEKLMAVEVLWTPQDENDTLPEDELLENYPLLRPI